MKTIEQITTSKLWYDAEQDALEVIEFEELWHNMYKGCPLLILTAKENPFHIHTLYLTPEGLLKICNTFPNTLSVKRIIKNTIKTIDKEYFDKSKQSYKEFLANGFKTN